LANFCLFASKLAEDGTAALLVAVKDVEQALPDLAGLLAGVDALPDASVLVVADDGGGLGVVGGEALLEGLGVVVGALDEGLARDVVLHVHLGRVEGAVVGAARGRVDEAAGDAGDEQGVVDLELNGVLQGRLLLRQHLVEGLGLGDRPREAVEDEAALALLVGLELALDHANDNVVADEAAGVHDLLGLLAERGLLGDLGSEHVTGGLLNFIVVSEPGLQIRNWVADGVPSFYTYQVAARELLLNVGSLRSLA
jgi:hypothetical protein